MGTINLVPYKPVAGTLGDANPIDTAFDTLQNVINGNIDDANVNASSNVATQKGKALALTGATAATRFVGATASGAPASGTFLLGDFVVDQTGKMWVCTAAGSPGSWANVSGATGGPGTQIDRKTLASDVTGITASTEGTAAAVITGNSVSYDGTEVKVEFWAPGVTRTDASSVASLVFVLLRDAAVIGQFQAVGGPSTTTFGLAYGWAFDTPTAASHAYAVKAFVVLAGSTMTVHAGAGGAGNAANAVLRTTKA